MLLNVCAVDSKWSAQSHVIHVIHTAACTRGYHVMDLQSSSTFTHCHRVSSGKSSRKPRVAE